MNKQEIFDTVVRHAYAQRRKSQNDGGVCVYRGPNGNKCFVGALIPDEKYSPDTEELGPRSIAKELGFNVAGVGELMYRLQSVHDQYSVSEWPRELARAAYQFHLNTEVLDRLQRECPL